METGETTSKIVKKRKVVAIRVKWTEEMEKEVFDFSKSALIEGRGFEKPTANEFYRRFLAAANPTCFSDVTLEKLVQHMKTLKNAYHVALNWRNQTGQGILEADPGGADIVKREILKRCKYFDDLDEILGDRPQFNPPYIHHTDVLVETSASGDDNEDIRAVETELETEMDRAETAEGDSTTATDAETGDAVDPLEGSENLEVEPPRAADPKKTPSGPAVASRLLTRKRRQSPLRNAVGSLDNAMKMRADVEQKRLDWESKCKVQELEEKREDRLSQAAIHEARLQFDKQKWKDEVQMKERAESQKFELQKLKIEKEAELALEKMKQQFELEKWKLSNDK